MHKLLELKRQVVLVTGYADAESRHAFTYPELMTATGEVFWVDRNYTEDRVERDFPWNSLVVIEPTSKFGFDEPQRGEFNRIWRIVKEDGEVQTA